MASPRIIMKLTVTAARKEPGDVLVIDLKHPRKPVLPAFEAGSHVDVHLPEGKVRQYSLCGDPTELGRYTIAVKRENDGRGGSAWIHETIAVGSTLPVSAPRNHFALKPGEGPTLLLAGGIGITPILAMARALTRQAKPFELHYFTRSRALTPLLAAIGSDLPGGNVRIHFDDEPQTRQNIAALLANRSDDAQTYYCGPPGFMAVVGRAAQHWPEGTVHFETFQPPEFDGAPPEPFVIELAEGRVVEVSAETTALAALRAAGVPLMASCENGVCGTCECAMLAGQPIHRDAVLSKEARGHRFIPCVSRATGVLKLDL
ncbi:MULTISPECIES: PDR/VanB family oxidoreductase [unclassified Mesorhizobium]|uniref:PDR/VanB family oxidoreductase n=1 Tax=unclassified Mesorhizobium TaxID=325217 RepID=UPI0003CF468A|nr:MULTISPECIES: PDR/VanB family oxidoreductase [unclassified Mesorhizobium]ESX08504.1 ferredoxin [Mesorhizobium sp. LSJC265A00]ESX29371.1 ferredoxin [Mesorhizobium sp. LSHC440B00]ESX43181.1 ferredoxin [Mesorhizobium sp. LSHC440A00]ESY56054.1 ferredoxin [Mesorhizobium sp. LNJC374B00]ESY61210.1 ferredoxin [Mesorhizobium sp. LNJC372A00]